MNEQPTFPTNGTRVTIGLPHGFNTATCTMLDWTGPWLAVRFDSGEVGWYNRENITHIMVKG